MNILQDIKAAVKLTGEVRKARKAGASGLQVRPVYRLPALRLGYWTQTMEACLMRGGDTEKAVVKAFEAFPEQVQHSLTFYPKEPGEWVERARFWQRELKPALTPEMYHEVMLLFVGRYIRCLRARKEVRA